ncbi:hypothetical protein AB0L13_40295 [Saccharopolyspora shandongensis]|uniref:hypothetical protein n=1 Tax=Saccharopolyspora shandongensis TaxID=418495 RepID=UPI00343D0CAB
MNIKDAALPAAVLRVLEDRVKAARQQANTNVIESGDPEDRVTAAHNGQKIGSVSISKGRQSARVNDPDRFARWIAEHYPAEVEHKTIVREAFVKAVMDATKAAGQPCMPDGTLDVPGVEIYEGEPYVTVRLTHEAAEIVAEMVRTGAVTLDGGMPALKGGATG